AKCIQIRGSLLSPAPLVGGGLGRGVASAPAGACGAIPSPAALRASPSPARAEVKQDKPPDPLLSRPGLAPRCRRRAELALEGAAECGFGLVAAAFGHAHDGVAARAQ